LYLFYKNSDKIDCSIYKDISLSPTTYKILSNILLSRLTPCAEEIIRVNQCGFRRNRSTTDHIFCIRQINDKKWEHQEAACQLFIDFKKAYDSFSREVLYNTGLFIGPSGTSELDCATTKIDTAERSISIGRESLKAFFDVELHLYFRSGMQANL
jgi:hypothetical protein